MEQRTVRPDHEAIARRVRQGARVLDVGCGDGALLDLLKSTRSVDARGLELSSETAGIAMARGLSVIQGDADSDLELFPDDSFEVAILSQAVQQMRRPARVLGELARIAPEVIVSFRNYGLWSRRLTLIRHGRMPAPGLAHEDGVLLPVTALDMIELAGRLGLACVAVAPVRGGEVGAFRNKGLKRLNWGADEVILHLRRM
ncbi:methyltransferase domain-containing protein [Henriciella barbarensis]|uniref:Methyltransferase domain-containing protein n=1 Tax=Henriciella barbarensis TaxID=86342 RepID=A0A399R0Y6_9PROT|nr:methionine biosynthesis protein MetW [Henriciella barbarensis]RIJ24451.1 methyltransferase domain-containing protein [Henriciella barbarensis]